MMDKWMDSCYNNTDYMQFSPSGGEYDNGDAKRCEKIMGG